MPTQNLLRSHLQCLCASPSKTWNISLLFSFYSLNFLATSIFIWNISSLQLQYIVQQILFLSSCRAWIIWRYWNPSLQLLQYLLYLPFYLIIYWLTKFCSPWHKLNSTYLQQILLIFQALFVSTLSVDLFKPSVNES